MNKGNSGIKHTCPDIDKAISILDEAMKICEAKSKLSELDKYDQNDLGDAAQNIYSVCGGRNNMLENLRAANDELRNWGEEQFSRAEELENNLSNSEQRINELEDRINELEKELNSVTERG